MMLPILLLCLSLAAAEHVTLKPRVGGASKGLRAAGGFLSGPDLQDDLRQAVVETLGGGNRTLDATREKLRPMWSALAKNQQGRIDRRSLRYALHRYFLHAHSLSLVGLEPLQANSSHSEAALLTAFAPDYVRGLVEGRNAGHGFSFEDTVALVAVLEHLVVETGHGMLEAAYQAKGLKAAAGMSRQQLVEVMQAFMVRFMLGNEGADVVAEVDRNPKMLQEVFDDWKVLSSFAEGQIRTFEYSRWSGYSAGTVRNGRSSKVHWQVRLDRGALSQSFEFADAQAVAGSIAMSFGSFWTTECSRIKGLLMDMDRGATGRVKLADFHHAALNGEWRFGESADYLRQLGALDESSALLGPRVIIPNYLQSASNCIVTQEHYRVCCKNECEDYLSEIEAAVGAPTATPELVLAVVGNITTSLDDECAKIPASLMTQLFDIANSHDGSISLHGRLFAQWLHYVFPQDCPFPHKSGTTVAMSPTEFGQEFMATKEEMNMSASQTTAAQARTSPAEEEIVVPEDDWMTQWNHEEELLTEHVKMPAPWEQRIGATSILGLVVTTGALAMCVLGGHSYKTSKDKEVFLPMTSTFKGSKTHFY